MTLTGLVEHDLHFVARYRSVRAHLDSHSKFISCHRCVPCIPPPPPSLPVVLPRSFVRRRREQRSREKTIRSVRAIVGVSGSPVRLVLLLPSLSLSLAHSLEPRTHFRNEICEIIAPTLPPTAPVSTDGIRGILKTTAAAGP